jgi:uncharacterized protein YcbK (DUF882 family)
MKHWREFRPWRSLTTGAPGRWLTAVAGVSAALAVTAYHVPPAGFEVAPIEAIAKRPVRPLPLVSAAPHAFGRSGRVRVAFSLPGAQVPYPLRLQGDTVGLSYSWVSLDGERPEWDVRPLAGALRAPSRPGFYRLALGRGRERRVVEGPTLAVMVPFAQKVGRSLNGYLIGSYVSERLGAATAPSGFVEVTPSLLDVPLTEHLRLGDFLSQDSQRTWPRYVAVNPRLLDKLELVMAEVARLRGDSSSRGIRLGVSSTFRTPMHNRAVQRAASDSRHQYGDAADVRIDVDGDGHLTAFDSRLVALAVEMVELRNPDLVGGLGLYTSRRYNTPYVHIDARGKRARWRG